MKYYEVAPIKLVRKDAEVFTYSHETNLAIGIVVKIPLGKTTLLGVVMKHTTRPNFATKAITSVVLEQPLPRQLITTALWMSTYYQVHLSVVLSALLPRGIERKRRVRAKSSYDIVRHETDQTPTPSQQKVIDAILASQSSTQLLHGITGSGKTLVYKKCVQKILSQGKSAIILVPEIALTSQIIDTFTQSFGEDIIVTHSQQSEAERHIAWQKALVASEPKVVIGPRSALFMPLSKVGIVVVDEFHEPSYKQEQSPRYSTLRVATMLAKQHNCTALFGSATPPVAEYYLAQHNRAPIHTLNASARLTTKPAIKLVDATKRNSFFKHHFLSTVLLDEIDATLAQKKQVLLFHNRRGTASTTLCKECGWIATDPETELPLVLHADRHRLVSHVSSFSMPVPTSCPICKAADIVHKGIGTKLIESEIKKLYPNKVIMRFDGDTTQQSSLNQHYSDIYNGKVDILIGTQVLAKGLDLPHLHTVGVIQADAGLSLPDYQASERTFQLLAQVVGRVGRTNTSTTVVVQSYQPSHPAITYGITQNYMAFYDYTLKERSSTYFPPFCYLARFMCSYKTEAAAIRNAKALFLTLKNESSSDVRFYGPAPMLYEKQHGAYRWQIIAKSPTRSHLSQLRQCTPPKSWQFELDPISLL